MANLLRLVLCTQPRSDFAAMGRERLKEAGGDKDSAPHGAERWVTAEVSIKQEILQHFFASRFAVKDFNEIFSQKDFS